MTLRSRVGATGHGVSLLDYLAARFPYHDRARWQAEIAAGRVRVGDAASLPHQRLRRGDTIAYARSEREPWVDDRIVTLHEDAQLLVVAKPAHMPMHADGPFVHSTLVNLLRERRGEPGLGLVHRLDRETSGVVVLARTDAARKHLQAQFEHGGVRKSYEAVVHGVPAPAWTVAAPIGHAPGSEVALRRSCADDALAPKPAVSHCERLVVGSGRSLVRIAPETGRTHQIRVHLAHSGHPIVGDKIYGQPDAHYLAFVAAVKASGDPRTVPGCRPHRHLLHAAAIAFRHPSTGDAVQFACARPPEFDAWLGDPPPAGD